MTFQKPTLATLALVASSGIVSAQEAFFQCSGSYTEANVMEVEPRFEGAFQFFEPAQASVAAGLSLEEEAMSPPPLNGVRSVADVEMVTEYISNLYEYENGSPQNVGVGVSTDFMTLVNAASNYCANGIVAADLYRDAPNPNTSYTSSPFPRRPLPRPAQ